ncbi:MAG TPA: hypothetical protein ENN80_05815 [Candidatus Hydrogenedentes bacterium]|nr:hypothetical protein [Candidatus Hydrogenedentota bacterium]
MQNIEEFYGMWNGTGTREPVAQGVSLAGAVPVMMPVNLKNWDDDIPVGAKLAWTAIAGTGFAGGDMVRRLAEGVERYAIVDVADAAATARAQSQIAVMFDTFGNPEDSVNTAGMVVFNHVPGGCNVLYMDGHAEFVKYPGKFPICTDEENNYGLVRQVGHYGLF